MKTNGYAPMKKTVRRGRPRKDAITKLKVMAWFNAVAQVSGKTAAELEREFANPNHIRRSKDTNKEIRPGLWDKYRRGEVEPRGKPSKGRSISLVQSVEAKYPGTAKLLTLPLWKLLDFRQHVTIEELDAIQKYLPPDIQHLDVQKNVLAMELQQFDQKDVCELQSPQLHTGSSIDRWTMTAISLRKAMLVQQEALIDLMYMKLEATGLRRQKRSFLKANQGKITPNVARGVKVGQLNLF